MNMLSQEKKTEKYKRLYVQLVKLIESSPTYEASLATINAVLYHKIPYFFWVGFYFLSEYKLTVGPYQGPLACQELEYPKGVCWKSVLQNTTVIVNDVREFPEHIACDSRSRSEIAIPVENKKNEIIAVLDVDSEQLNAFDETDEEGLKKIVALITRD
jgi:GAF domain-containing protein